MISVSFVSCVFAAMTPVLLPSSDSLIAADFAVFGDHRV